jgi:hypothetical protein
MKRLQKRLAQLEAKLRYGASKFSKSQLFAIIQNILVVESAIATSQIANQVKAFRRFLSPVQAVDVINKGFKFSDSRCQAVLWEKYGKTRIYLNAVDRTRHLQKNGFIEYVNGKFDCSNVSGFGNYAVELSTLLN